jgi:hypothetical protein
LLSSHDAPRRKGRRASAARVGSKEAQEKARNTTTQPAQPAQPVDTEIDRETEARPSPVRQRSMPDRIERLRAKQ